MTNKTEEVPVVVRFSLRLPDDLDRAVRHEAVEDSRGRNSMIQVLLREALRHRHGTEDPEGAPAPVAGKESSG